MEGQDAGVDAEQCIPTQHFHIPVFEVKGVMVVGSIGDSSSEVSATVKSERLAMLMDGDWVAGVTAAVSASGAATGSSGGG